MGRKKQKNTKNGAEKSRFFYFLLKKIDFFKEKFVKQKKAEKSKKTNFAQQKISKKRSKKQNF